MDVEPGQTNACKVFGQYNGFGVEQSCLNQHGGHKL